MSQRKLPKPTYLHMPDGIIDVVHRGYDIRIELRGLASRFPRFEFFRYKSSPVELGIVMTGVQREQFEDAISVWKGRYERHDDPDPEMPHAAIFRVLDLIVDYEKRKVVEYKAAFPNSVLGQLQERARKAREAINATPVL